MLSQSPQERPVAVVEIKQLIQRYHSEAVTLQRLSKIDGTVIRSKERDEPLAHEPPLVVGVDWNHGRLTLVLDRPVTQDWIAALLETGGAGAPLGKGPERFTFVGKTASVDVAGGQAQMLVDAFKSWLPLATRKLKTSLEHRTRKKEAERGQQLRMEREQEEQRLRVLRNLRI